MNCCGSSACKCFFPSETARTAECHGRQLIQKLSFLFRHLETVILSRQQRTFLIFKMGAGKTWKLETDVCQGGERSENVPLPSSPFCCLKTACFLIRLFNFTWTNSQREAQEPTLGIELLVSYLTNQPSHGNFPDSATKLPIIVRILFKISK